MRPTGTILISALFFAFCADAKANYPIDFDMKGMESSYTGKIRELVAHWKSSAPDKEPRDFPIRIDCYRDPKSDFAIGIRQQQWIHAPMEKVEAVVDDLPGYAKIVSDLEKVEILERDRNKWLTRWEQHVPFPFVPNDKSEIYYLNAKEKSGERKFYRYQLKRGDNLKYNDGVIVIERKSASLTLYTEYDFWDADWGIAKAAGEDKLWQSNVSGTIQSDLAVKIKAENPSWSDEKIMDASNEITHALPIKEWVKLRGPMPGKLPDSQ